MKSFTPIVLTTLFSIAATAEPDCPIGWLENHYRSRQVCCSGNMFINETGAHCCVYDMRLYKEALTNTALLYETATSTSEIEWSTMDRDTCIAKVPVTATDYSAQVSSAASKAEATPTDTSASETTSASTTGAGSRSGTGSQTVSQTGTETSTPTSNAAMPLATAKEIVAGGAAFAAALFVL